MIKIKYLSLILLSLFLFSRCQKEDIYNPKEKLLSILDYEISSKTPFVSFLYEEEKISKAIFHDQTVFEFEYNEENQVSAIYGYFGNKPYGYVLMTYIDKKLSKTAYYDQSNTVFQIDTFYRHNGLIYGYKSYINVSEAKNSEDKITPTRLFQTFMHTHQAKQVKAIVEDLKSGFVLIAQTNVEYTRQNITQLETVYQNGFTTLSRFSYDDEKNPLYGLPFAFTEHISFPTAPLSGYSKNNFVSFTYSEHYGTPGAGETETYELVYQKNDYPTQIYTVNQNETTLRWQFNYIE